MANRTRAPSCAVYIIIHLLLLLFSSLANNKMVLVEAARLPAAMSVGIKSEEHGRIAAVSKGWIKRSYSRSDAHGGGGPRQIICAVC
ncbi:unnamed protein product [Linum tenue]|uniref:Secreted protein n=1 Tax=Linum tenue TaxID=586396 RepID=A0AAV0PSF7_9ROSI|nr:unnamed protein product [Linum tenue]